LPDFTRFSLPRRSGSPLIIFLKIHKPILSTVRNLERMRLAFDIGLFFALVKCASPASASIEHAMFSGQPHQARKAKSNEL
jgi:hypothetical protein